jgi:predicted RNA-binding Zn-ribbon protein involved in translation (DUF1610 family)
MVGMTEPKTDRMVCEICDAEFRIEAYGDGACPHCGQQYVYDEGYALKLSDEQKAKLLREARSATQELHAKYPQLQNTCLACGAKFVRSGIPKERCPACGIYLI